MPHVPRILRFGRGCSAELPTVLQRLGVHRPFVVVDGRLTKVLPSALHDAVREWPSFRDVVPDPTTGSVRLAQARVPPDCDVIVGIGGGSAMDTAKAVALLAKAPPHTSLRDVAVPAEPTDALPTVAIPTTAGTGSEVSGATVITDGAEKLLLSSPVLVPHAALVDPTLTHSVPPRLTAYAGLDALCHAMEAYVSRRATHFSDAHAMAAMPVLAKHLRRAYTNGDDLEAREGLMYAATHAGLAFANASVTLIHGMARPLGAHFGVPHGLANAMLLPIVTRFSCDGAPERYAACARAMDFGTTPEDLVRGLETLCRDLDVPSPALFGVDADDYRARVDVMVEQALASGSPQHNPLVPSKKEVRTLYLQVFSHRNLF